MARARRLLLECCYDFWAVDGYDGERSRTCDTLAEAKAEQRRMRAQPHYVRCPWDRCRITVEWAVSERKVLAHIAQVREDISSQTLLATIKLVDPRAPELNRFNSGATA